MHIIAHILPAILLLTLAAARNRPLAADNEEYRLPKNIVPSHYSLDLTVDPDSPNFTGFVEIKITATDAADGLVRLHASPGDLTLGTVLLDYEKTCELTATDEVTDIVTLACPRDYLDGEHRLVIQFVGKFSTDDMDGFYKSTYEENGVQYVLVSTQFESTSARRAFPCFDEPSFKATFDVFITHSPEYAVLANTPKKQDFTVGDGLIQTEFETTPTMSTYLVAFVISKFTANGNHDDTNYLFKVYARPGAANFTSVATTFGPTLIDLLSNWIGINYVDLGDRQAYEVAIPDFAAGAMENWGLITFREVDLLDEDDKTSASAKQRVITVIAHELSHMWFGDYVTLDWWSDTWLNEGFATYFEFNIPALIPNEHLETDKQQVITSLQPVLRSDSLPSSLPLTNAENDINTPSEDSSKFDAISYDKGGSIVRMMSYILGQTAFKAGLQSYLRTNHNSNTNPSLLLSALTEASGGKTNVSQVMENWIYKAGFPLVTVKLNDNGDSVQLTQERFITVQNATAEATQWYVPISYTTSDERDFSINIKSWLEPDSTLNVTVNGGSWIIFNIQEAGFYRVNYDDELWDRITAALNNQTERIQIDVLNRAQLVDDVFNIARVGKIDYEKAFRLAEFLGSETEYYPWVSALNAISYLIGKLGDSEAEGLLQNRTLRWINSASQNMSDTTAHIDVLRGALIQDWACRLGQEECIAYAKTTFAYYNETGRLPNYNRRGTVFCYALRNSDDARADYTFLFNVFKQSQSSVEQNVIISSLGCISDPDVLLSYLSETIANNSAIRKQDAASVFRAVYANSDTGVDVALTFLENNLPKITDTYKGMSALSGLISGLADRVKTDEQINRLTKLIDGNASNEVIHLVGQRAKDTIAANKAWTATYGDSIKSVLQKTEPAGANIPKPMFVLSIILGLAVFCLSHF